MRIAFVDLMFSWPPRGGAEVDLREIICAAQSAGHEVHLFATRNTKTWNRGVFEADALPFPATRLDVPPADFNHRALPARIREAVAAHTPDLVYVGCGFDLKFPVVAALEGYPLVARYYSYEAACRRDFLQQIDGDPCPKDYFTTPNFCRRCALEGQADAIKDGPRTLWTDEYLAAEAYRPEYYDVSRRALAALDAAVVYNPRMGAPLEGFVKRVRVVPGGVDVAKFPYAPEVASASGRAKILMTGRCEDPLKGVDVLRAAGAQLAKTRDDFEILVTLPEDTPRMPWFRPVGWCSHDEVRAHYAEAAVCVVPSLWEEPFGIVAVEAMATGRAVCASRVGGLQYIVRDGETGFLFDRGDSATLAERLARLLDDSVLRTRMGVAGRRRSEEEYDWSVIFDRYYAPLFEEIAAERRPDA